MTKDTTTYLSYWLLCSLAPPRPQEQTLVSAQVNVRVQVREILFGTQAGSSRLKLQELCLLGLSTTTLAHLAVLHLPHTWHDVTHRLQYITAVAMF
ncbi:hypothetical protein E2C01_013812 [Portunus trituberculatus]|uniref:Uncharacterized protein n=1 Tax=Portunus trituberculatus TaxID=210409 RepID=A0A5B7DHM5_PORTR|nr:hypothetical protein [Portunus trituberculatus]